MASCGGDAQAAPELALDAEPVEHAADLRAAAVHDDRVEAGHPQEHDVLGERALEGVVGHRVAAVLHHDRLAVVGLQPRQGPGERGGLGGRLLPLRGRPALGARGCVIGASSALSCE